MLKITDKIAVRTFKEDNVEVISDMPIEDLNYIVDAVKNDALDYLPKLGSGSYGDVYEYKGYAIKTLFREDDEFKDDGRNNDVQALKDLSHLDCVPKIYAVINNKTMIVERIQGLRIKDVCEYGKAMDGVCLDRQFKRRFDDSLTNIILGGYSPEDVHEGNVMIEAGTNLPKIIDTGWFKRHHENCEEATVEELKCNVEGYSKAQRWAGYAIDRYLDRFVQIV